jgi:hypothetical protein
MADSSVGEVLTHSVIVSFLSKRNVMDVEGIIKRNSTLLEAMDNVSVGMEAYVEVSRNTLEFDKACQSAALMLLKLLLYSVLQGLTMNLLLFPSLCREYVTLLAQSVFVHFSVVVRDVLSETIFNIKTKYVTRDVRVLNVDVNLNSIALMASLEGKTRMSLRVHVITHLTSAQYNQNARADEGD